MPPVVASPPWQHTLQRSAGAAHEPWQHYACAGALLIVASMRHSAPANPPTTMPTAAQRGLHVLVTKPPVKTLAEHQELARLARDNGVLVMVE